MSGILIVYLIVVNIVGFVIMGVDKKKAVRDQWRIPEKVLFLVSLIGGSAGTWIGMYIFRHKTKKWYFVIFMPLILVGHILLLIKLF